MIYWAIYDIRSNKSRTKVANICKDFGLKRIQYSSFLGVLTKNKAEMLAIEARRYLSNKDKLLLMPAGKEDFDKKIVMGDFDNSTAQRKEVIFLG